MDPQRQRSILVSIDDEDPPTSGPFIFGLLIGLLFGSTAATLIAAYITP